LTGLASTGGGAGGRVAITYTDSEFTGSYVAYGGRSAHSTGGAGTVYVNAGSKSKLYIDNKQASNVDVSTCFQKVIYMYLSIVSKELKT
jgi:hypothetical protein